MSIDSWSSSASKGQFLPNFAWKMGKQKTKEIRNEEKKLFDMQRTEMEDRKTSWHLNYFEDKSLLNIL